MNISPLALALALAVSASSALASDDNKPVAGHEMHDKMAMPAMPAMSPAEHQRWMNEMFASIDANKDGSISKAEFTNHHEAMMKKHHDGMMKMDHGCKMDMDHEHMDHGKMKMEEKPASGK